MKKRLMSLLMLLLLSTGALQYSAVAAGKKVLYRAKITTNYAGATTVYSAPLKDPRSSKPSQRLGTFRPGAPIDVVDVLPNYLEINYARGTGFVLRHRTMDVVAVDPANTARYGTVVSRYYTVLDRETAVRAEPDDSAEALITLGAGTRLAFMDITDGWARLIFKRQYAYVNTFSLPELEMIAPREADGDSDTPIAAYNSFYNIQTNEANLNRMHNLAICSQRMDRVMQPGEQLDFNNTVGPFNARNGYLEANALFEGELVPAYGGGSCQASSTLYNVVLQLTGLTVIARAPHGANGAPYLPHGVDASSGDLNFIFRNDYSFAIRLVSHVQDGVLFIAIYRDSAA
ncbi:MAG: VanW family protein [Christensenellales bacterium]